MMKKFSFSIVILSFFVLGGCATGTMQGAANESNVLFGAVALRSKERVMLKQNLNQLSMKVSVLSTISPSLLQSASRAKSISTAIQGICNNLVGAMPKNVDVQKFAHVAQIIGEKYWQYAFVPVVTAKMIQFQASYTNILIQYITKEIGKLREADIKNLLAVLQTSVTALSGITV